MTVDTAMDPRILRLTQRPAWPHDLEGLAGIWPREGLGVEAEWTEPCPFCPRPVTSGEASVQLPSGMRAHLLCAERDAFNAYDRGAAS